MTTGRINQGALVNRDTHAHATTHLAGSECEQAARARESPCSMSVRGRKIALSPVFLYIACESERVCVWCVWWRNHRTHCVCSSCACITAPVPCAQQPTHTHRRRETLPTKCVRARRAKRVVRAHNTFEPVCSWQQPNIQIHSSLSVFASQFSWNKPWGDASLWECIH